MAYATILRWVTRFVPELEKRWVCFSKPGKVSLLAIALCFARMAGGQTDEIQVYDAEIAAPGSFTLTSHDNVVSSGSTIPAFTGGIEPDKSLNGTLEWAYGLRPWLELGLYFPLYSMTHDGSVLYNGAKWRMLFVSPGASERPWFYGVNFEFSFNTRHWDQHPETLEIRPIIGAHLGAWDVIFNPIVDGAYNGTRSLEFVPASRVAYSISERYKVAIEEYDNFGRLSHFLPRAAQSHQLFMAVDWTLKHASVEVGLGGGLTPSSDHRVIKLILNKDL